MPQQSRYTNDQFELIMNDVILTLQKHNADRDLSLMVLGNVVTHIVNTQVAPEQRKALTDQFCAILSKSTKV